MPLHLNSLKIDDFRGLSDLKMENLGRVNLLVGRNNSGKTRVLEALRLLGAGGSIEILRKISAERDESDTEEGLRFTNPEAKFLRHFFNGRKFPEPDEAFFIGEEGKYHIAMGSRLFIRIEKSEDDEIRIIRKLIKAENLEEMREKNQPVFRDIFRAQFQNDKQISIKSLASEDIETGELVLRRAPRLPDPDGQLLVTTSQFVPSSFINHDELSALWDEIVLTDAEAEAIKVMQAVDPKIKGLAFIGEKSERHPVVRISDDDPVPLGSLGDGVYRAFQLGLNLVNSENGFLLIDEFENGLHYSVMVKVWSFIFEFAKKLNTQVFATTHSDDCIQAFAEVATQHSELGCAYHLGQSILDGSIITTRYDETRLAELLKLDRDIR
jgi:predicted ATP-dependent endonuclease of OLD family